MRTRGEVLTELRKIHPGWVAFTLEVDGTLVAHGPHGTPWTRRMFPTDSATYQLLVEAEAIEDARRMRQDVIGDD